MKKSLFADELATGMMNELKPEIVKQASVNLVKAVDYLNTDFEILDEAGFKSQADKILDILNKIGNNDTHTKGLTSEKMVKNLLDHGTEFNMADDGQSDDLLNLDVMDDGLEVSEDKDGPEMDFEDEI